MWKNPYRNNPFRVLGIDRRADNETVSRRAGELAGRPGASEDEKRAIAEALKRVVGPPVDRIEWELFCPVLDFS